MVIDANGVGLVDGDGKSWGDAKREEEDEYSERGRAGYIDEGRARRLPRDHTRKRRPR